MKRFFLAIALIFAALGLAGCSGIIGEDKVKMDDYDNAAQYSVGNFTYSKENVSRVEIEWYLGDIEIVESTERTLNVKESGISLSEEMQLRYFITDRTLKIKFWKSGYSAVAERGTKNLRVEISQGIALEIETEESKVQAPILTVQSLEIESVSGNVSLGSVAAADSVEIETQSGNISASSLTARSAEIDSDSGSVTLPKIDCTELSIDALSGDVTLSFIRCSRLEVETISATVTLNLGTIGMELNYTTSSGSLSTAMQYTKLGERYVFGNGACNAKVKTSSGNIIVK